MLHNGRTLGRRTTPLDLSPNANDIVTLFIPTILFFCNEVGLATPIIFYLYTNETIIYL
jgi:hypothetical protein